MLVPWHHIEKESSYSIILSMVYRTKMVLVYGSCCLVQVCLPFLGKFSIASWFNWSQWIYTTSCLNLSIWNDAFRKACACLIALHFQFVFNKKHEILSLGQIWSFRGDGHKIWQFQAESTAMWVCVGAILWGNRRTTGHNMIPTKQFRIFKFWNQREYRGKMQARANCSEQADGTNQPYR
jgi:hypothetical protein